MTTPAGTPQPSYKKPPIIEAVIALHFSTPLELKLIDAFARKHKTSFPNNEDVIEMSTSFNAQTQQTTSNTKKIGRKLTNIDNAKVITIMHSQLAISYLAPYTNWGELCNEAREHWSTFPIEVKNKALERVSTRFVNRIDIPVDISDGVDMHKYFNAGLSLPLYTQTMALDAFLVNCSLHHASEPYMYVLNIASTPSPLIGHVSFTIDIDVATTGPVPFDKDKMWELVDSLREHKNNLFESCITPETRALFQ